MIEEIKNEKCLVFKPEYGFAQYNSNDGSIHYTQQFDAAHEATKDDWSDVIGFDLASCQFVPSQISFNRNKAELSNANHKLNHQRELVQKAHQVFHEVMPNWEAALHVGHDENDVAAMMRMLAAGRDLLRQQLEEAKNQTQSAIGTLMKHGFANAAVEVLENVPKVAQKISEMEKQLLTTSLSEKRLREVVGMQKQCEFKPSEFNSCWNYPEEQWCLNCKRNKALSVPPSQAFDKWVDFVKETHDYFEANDFVYFEEQARQLLESINLNPSPAVAQSAAPVIEAPNPEALPKPQ